MRKFVLLVGVTAALTTARCASTIPPSTLDDVANYATDQVACMYIPDASYDEVTACRNRVKRRWHMLDGGTE